MRRLFCGRPFEHLEVMPDGSAYVCCPSWLPTSIGNVHRSGAEALWNGTVARQIRESILDNSFRYCTACPFLKTRTAFVHPVDERLPPAERALLEGAVTVMGRIGTLNLAYDRTCNLSCPSCRKELYVAKGEEYQRLAALQARVLERDLLARLSCLYVTGSGDPFASRLFRELVRGIDPARYPRLSIRLHTNALLWTPEAWEALGPARALVREVEVSIDAASAQTYAVNRRGGDWETLLANLGFVAWLRRERAIGGLQISFVVQANNWRQMPAFVELGRRNDVDLVFFSKLRNWGTFSDQEYRARAVHLPEHPEHARFRAGLDHPALARPNVLLGELRERTG